jgi:hypothetical protein
MRVLLATVVAAVLFGVGAGSASASSQCGDCTASYSGTWTVSWPFGTSGNAMVTLNFAESLRSGNWSLTSASGSYTEPAQPDNHYPGCNATLTRNASAAAMLGSFGPNVITRRSGYWTAELFPPTYWGVPGDPVNSSQTTGDCATSARVDYAGLSQSLGGAQCHFDPSAGNTEAIDFPVSSSYTTPDNCTGTITSNTVDYNVTLHSSVTFTSPGVVSPGSTRTPEQVRAYARREWRSLVPIYMDVLAQQNIVLHYLRSNLALNLRGTSAEIRDWLNTIGFQNDLLLKSFRKVNAGFENLLALLERAYNDPPLTGSSPAPVAKVTPFRFTPSSCTSIAPRSRGFCTRLQRDAANWIDAGATLDALARALATDVGRETTAGRANDTSAVARLQDAELALLPRLTAARDDQQHAGSRFGAALRGIGVDIRITKSKTAAGIARFLAKLAQDGVTGADVQAILGQKLVPRPLSFDSLVGG